MRYFWVNQKQTYKQEREGGYLWAPKLNSNGNQHWGWKTMVEVNPGDVIFNNVNGALRSYCIATSAAYDFTKPAELEQEWEQLGWKIDARYIDLSKPIVISEYLDEIGDLFPKKYSKIIILSVIQLILMIRMGCILRRSGRKITGSGIKTLFPTDRLKITEFWKLFETFI